MAKGASPGSRASVLLIHAAQLGPHRQRFESGVSVTAIHQRKSCVDASHVSFSCNQRRGGSRQTVSPSRCLLGGTSCGTSAGWAIHSLQEFELLKGRANRNGQFPPRLDLRSSAVGPVQAIDVGLVTTVAQRSVELVHMGRRSYMSRHVLVNPA